MWSMVHISRWLLRSPRPAGRPARVRLLAEWLEDRAVPAALPDPALVALARIDSGGDRTGPLAKVGFDLALLSREAAAAGGASFTPTNSLLQVTQGYVAVEAFPTGSAAALGSKLAGLGYVGGWLPIRSIAAAAELPELAVLRPAYRLVTNAGGVMTQGDTAQRSDDVRRLLGFDGTGVSVGVISDSFNILGGASADVASGDLPANVGVLSEGAGGADEGRAMLQVIHDIAPGANLLFTAAGTTQLQLATSIRALANAGADIIVDDVTFPAEPMFQDGPVAQAVDQVVTAGVVYFSAAGNLGRQSYESAYRFSGENLGSSGTGLIPTSANFLAHNFSTTGGVDYLQSVSLPAGKTTFSFQWVDRYASAGGPGARIDMDMALFDENGVFLSLIGGFSSNIGGDPTEVFEVDAGAGGRYQIALGKFSVTSPDPALLKYVAFSDGFVQDEYDTQSSTVFGHANAAGAAAVGAARYSDTPRFGTNPGVARTFSGRGGTPVFTFDANGDPTGSTTRQEPRFVAPDGVNTTFFGATDDEPDGRPNFTGTSAAAPHAAGVAALMLQANRNLTPAQVIDTLSATALDIGAAGVDVDTGAGLIQAMPAVLAVGGHFDVTLDGGDGDDAFLVRRNLSGTEVEFFKNGTLLAAIPADKLGRVTVHGGAGSDSLTVDHVNGTPLASAGLSFAGGETTGDNDRLVITGYSVDLVVVSHDGPETGTVQIGTTGLVSFAEVEPVELMGDAADLVVNLPTTPNPGVEVGDDGPAGQTGYSAVSGPTFEYTRFRNPTHALVVGLGAGGNTVALRALDANFAATVTVTGGSGMDAVTLFGGAGDDAVTYAPDAGDGGVLTLTRGSVTTQFTLAGIESLAADGQGQPGADALTVNAPRAGVAFGTAAGSATVNVASAAGSLLLALAYRNFEQAAVAATIVAVDGTNADDGIRVSADGTVEVDPDGGNTHTIRVAADRLNLNGFAGGDGFIIAADHAFGGGVSVDGGDTTGANSLRVVGSGGAVMFTPTMTGQVIESGFGAIGYSHIGPVDVDAGAGHLTLKSVAPNGTADILLTGPNSASAQLMTASQVTLSAASLLVLAPTSSSGDGLRVAVASASADATLAGGAVQFAGFLAVTAGVGVDFIIVAGGAADDTFTVTPGPLPVAVEGGSETAGDRLVLVGAVPGRPAAGSGSLGTTPGITYQDIELFTLGAVPTPAPDSASTPEGQAVTISVLANDAGLTDGPIRIAIVSQPASGAVRVVGDTLVYTPAPGATPAVGPITFTYSVTDANGESADGTVTVTLTPVNDAPQAASQAVALAANSSVEIVLVGDDGDPEVTQTLTVTIITTPNHGTLSGLDPLTGRVTYTPAPGYDGPDYFTFVLSDDATAGGPARTSAPATVFIQVVRQNRPPVAVDDSVTVAQGSFTTSPFGGVRSNDADPDGDFLVVTLVSGVAHGKLALDQRGNYTYTPEPGFSGTDAFVYSISDPHGASATATVTITVTPTPRRFIATGAGSGGGPHVKVFDADSGAEVYSFFAYDSSFRGGVRVAVGDVNGDGVPDIVTTPGPGGGPHVKVFSGVDLSELASYFAYDPGFRSGANVAVGDLDGDGVAEIVTGAAPGGGSHVRSFHVARGGVQQLDGPLGSFFAFGPEFSGGVNVALGNYDGVGGDEIIVGAATLSPEVRVIGRDGAVLAAFLAFDVARVGITVAAGDVDGDGKADIVVGPGDGGGPVVRTFRGGTGELMNSTAAFDENLRGGISVATTASRTTDGRAAVIVAPTEQARSVLVLDPGGDALLAMIDAYAADFPGGVFVGAG